MGKQNICRPVIFYNNFLPPVKDVQGWQYCAWGIWDGIDVEKNIVSDEGTVLSRIWEHQKEFCKQMEGRYTAQIIYAMKYDEVSYDEEFWSEEQDRNYPFTFFVRVQLRGNAEKLWEDRLAVQENMGCEGKVIANTYLTYDNFDLLIALKAISYEAGEDVINGLYHQDVLKLENGKRYRVKNSFSVFAMKQDIINRMEKNAMTGLLEEADVRMIERREGGIGAIEKLLKECPNSIFNDDNCVRKQILGVEDEIISFKGIPWNTFLSLYKDKEGIFNHANLNYQEYLSGTTTVFARKAPAYVVKDEEDKKSEAFEEGLYGWYIERIRTNLERLKENENSDLCKEWDVIVNAFSKFKQPVFSDYVFLTMMQPLDCLLDLILMNARRGKDAVIDSRQYLFDFLKNLNLYTQNAIGSDRNSIQIMDINDKIYAIPVKLNAFYNAYIFQVCGLLNRPIKEEGKEENIPQVEYNFLAMPGIADRVCVIELYKRVCEEKRFIKVEIPEQEYYDPKGMMIILAHEVAHYVGRDLREREGRYKSLLQVIAHIYICYVLQQYLYSQNENIPAVDGDTYIRLENRMASILEIVLDREVDLEYLKNEKIDMNYKNEADVDKGRIENKKYQFYISFIKKFAAEALVSIADEGMEDVFAPFLYGMDEEGKKIFLEEANRATNGFVYEYEEGSTLLSLSTMMERLVMIYEECFADLMSILLLRMSPRDYFSCLLKEGLEQGIAKGNVEKYDYTFRALLVTICMLRQEESNGIFVWSVDDVVAHVEECEEYTDFVEEIGLLYQEYYIYEKKIYNTHDYDRNCTNIFKDKQIIKNIVNYLRECRKKYALMEGQYRDDEKGNAMTKRIRDLYQSSRDDASGNGLEFLMMEQQRLVEDYKKDLISIWQKKNQ